MVKGLVGALTTAAGASHLVHNSILVLRKPPIRQGDRKCRLSRHRGVSDCVHAPGVLRSDANPDSWSPCHWTDSHSTIFHEQSTGRQIDPVLRQRDAHGFRQIPGTAAELMIHQDVHRPYGSPLQGPHPPPAHGGSALTRIERANQNRRRSVERLRDDVDEAVNAVIEIDVCVARRPVQGRVATRRSGCRVTGRIRLANVGFGFDDDPGGSHAPPVVDDNLADQVASDVEGRAIIKRPRQQQGQRPAA